MAQSAQDAGLPGHDRAHDRDRENAALMEPWQVIDRRSLYYNITNVQRPSGSAPAIIPDLIDLIRQQQPRDA